MPRFQLKFAQSHLEPSLENRRFAHVYSCLYEVSNSLNGA